MKTFAIVLGIISLFLSTESIASPVDGKIIYKLPNGQLVKRDVVLEVPSRGQGEVILSGQNFEWRTDKFRSYTKKGKTTFIASFETDFMNLKSTIVFKGTYLKGSNELIYYGDFYKKKGHNLETEDLAGFVFQGGFKFSYLR
jgi:hypothetical protein